LTRDGHDQAFAVIAERYRRELIAHARRLAPKDRCEDILQQAMLSAWEALRQQADVHEARAWLHRIVRNVALSVARSSVDHEQLSDSLAAITATEAAVERRLGATAALAALAVFALNPNLLYLQSAPMTESVFFLGLLGLLYSMAAFRNKQSWKPVVGAGAASLVASLTSYEGWFLIPFTAAFFLFSGKRKPLLTACVFGMIASLAPLYWLAHNAWYFGDALAFYRGPYSPQAIQGTAAYPGDRDWAKALLYYRSAAQLCVGFGPIIAGAIGLLAAVRSRIWWPLPFLALTPAFYLWSIHSSGGTPISVPQLWPNSYYNTRYGLSVLPLIAFCAGAAVLLAPVRGRALAACAIAATIGLAPLPPICWKESEVNSQARRQWTHQAAQFFTAHYTRGAGIFSALGDLAGIYREAGIPLREVLHDGNNPEWDAAIARPDLFLHEQWAVAMAGDKVASAILKASRTGPHYERVETIVVKDAPVIEIYRRI